MAPTSWIRIASFATTLAAAVALPGSAGTKWDQARATKLAGQLEDATKRFEDELRKQPASTPSSGQPDSAERLRDQAQRLENSATSLAAPPREGRRPRGDRDALQGRDAGRIRHGRVGAQPAHSEAGDEGLGRGDAGARVVGELLRRGRGGGRRDARRCARPAEGALGTKP